MTDVELIEKHARLWRKWMAEAFGDGGYNSAATHRYMHPILALERQAKDRGISKETLMEPIKEER